jgi:hypothetical protein
MRMEFRALLVAVLMSAQTAVPPSIRASPLRQPKNQNDPKTQQVIVKEVRHALVMLPNYPVFNNHSYRVEGDKVILEGWVVRLSLKSHAAAVVKTSLASLESSAISKSSHHHFL